MGQGDVRVGISGWAYGGWRGTFYPEGLRRAEELPYVAARMRTVEVNGSFYSLQRPETYRSWVAATPPGFVLAVKGSRFVTHMKRLRDVRVPLANFLASGVLALGDRLGPLLWQLPPTFAFDDDGRRRLEDFLALLPRTTGAAAALAAEHDARVEGRACTTVEADLPLRHAVEVRHPSFESGAFVDLARAQQVAVVVADTAGRWPLIDVDTADHAYARLHGDTELYVSGYDDAALDRWAARAAAWAVSGRDVHVYFDNDVKVHAPRDAVRLAERVSALLPPPVRGPGGPP